jgi:UDP-2,4-diacetamido-2,4,6-trideoxy-beta-L-altropyranose hydrolase
MTAPAPVPTSEPAPPTLVLRPAGISDARLLWEWRNDPLVRANSFQSEPVAWETHLAWLQRKLASPDCRLWIAECEGRPVGQVRYDRDGALAEVSLSVAAPCRGRGLGAALLARSAPCAARDLQVRRLVAFIKPGNLPSRRAFERAGFRPAGPVMCAGVLCLAFEYVVDGGE